MCVHTCLTIIKKSWIGERIGKKHVRNWREQGRNGNNVNRVCMNEINFPIVKIKMNKLGLNVSIFMYKGSGFAI